MMIDEAIDFCKEKSKNIKLRTEPQTFEIIADMLEELKAIENGLTDDLLNIGFAKVYNKAIDDAENFICKAINHDGRTGWSVKTWETYIIDCLKQLKVGGTNDD